MTTATARRPPRAFVLGTAGHVDHGKTALVKALTGIETDRLPEEKKRGISIELGFAPWRLTPDLSATIIDVPGHRRLVHAMIAGASGIELVLLVVAANEGVMPQTREHVRVCQELGIAEAVIVLTKSDLVDEETLQLASAEALELVEGVLRATVVSCSAATGKGMEEVRDEVAARLRKLPPWSVTGPARLWVDRVLSIKGAGTVVTGTLSAGAIRRGGDLAVVGAGSVRAVVARELRVHDSVVEEAHAPTRLAVNLAVDASAVRRGDLLTADTDLAPTDAVDAILRGVRVRRGAEVSLHIGSAQVQARITRTSTTPGGAAVARLLLAEGRPLRGGDRFVVRGASTTADVSVAGGGSVIDARPHPRSRGERRKALAEAVCAGDARSTLMCLLEETKPAPVEPASLRGRLAIDHDLLVREAEAGVRRGRLVAVGSGFLAKEVLAALSDVARALVAEHAARAPLDRGLPVATLQQKLAQKAGVAAAAAAIRAARARRSEGDTELIAIDGDVAVPAYKRPAADPAVAGAVERVRAALGAAGGHGLSLAKAIEVTSKADDGRAVLAVLERHGAAVHTGDLWFARAVVDTVRGRLKEHFASSASVTVAELKTLCDLPRKQAVLLLEYFDQAGLTRRKGDLRVLVGGKDGG